LLHVSVRSFKKLGVDSAGLTEIMKAAGFTHGGFYNHFESKEALVLQAFASAFDASADYLEQCAATSKKDFARALDAYLSVETRDNPDTSCPTSALVVDAARQCRSVRSVFAHGIQRYLKTFEGRLPKIRGKSRDAAINTLAGMVGAMVLARAIGDADDELSREILRASRKETAGRVTNTAPKS
jgi:TetR/AcrR family transcriptional repressor of nem operon